MVVGWKICEGASHYRTDPQSIYNEAVAVYGSGTTESHFVEINQAKISFLLGNLLFINGLDNSEFDTTNWTFEGNENAYDFCIYDGFYTQIIDTLEEMGFIEVIDSHTIKLVQDLLDGTIHDYSYDTDTADNDLCSIARCMDLTHLQYNFLIPCVCPCQSGGCDVFDNLILDFMLC